MAVTVYKSTDGSAPTLSGTTGSLVALLDACLVTGYGSKSAAGWTKPYTAASKAVFRAGGGTQFYLDVDDAGPGVGTFKEARMRGYETMTAVATGTGPFPTAAQLSTGIICRKSATADATARAWILIADDKTFYLFVLTGDSAGVYFAFGFGDFYSTLSGDAYRCMINGRASENVATATTENLDKVQYGGNTFTASTGFYVSRAYTGAGGALAMVKQGDNQLFAGTSEAGMSGSLPFPNSTDGGYYITRVPISEPSGRTRRGWLRGFWHFGHAVGSVVDTDTITGSGDLAGRSFLIIKSGGNSSVYVIETSNTWDTST